MSFGRSTADGCNDAQVMRVTKGRGRSRIHGLMLSSRISAEDRLALFYNLRLRPMRTVCDSTSWSWAFGAVAQQFAIEPEALPKSV